MSQVDQSRGDGPLKPKERANLWLSNQTTVSLTLQCFHLNFSDLKQPCTVLQKVLDAYRCLSFTHEHRKWDHMINQILSLSWEPAYWVNLNNESLLTINRVFPQKRQSLKLLHDALKLTGIKSSEKKTKQKECK